MNSALPRWSQAPRQQLAYAIAEAIEDENTPCTEADIIAHLHESPPSTEYKRFPADWVRHWLQDRRLATSRASPRGQPKYGPRLPSDGEDIKVDQWGQVIDE